MGSGTELSRFCRRTECYGPPRAPRARRTALLHRPGPRGHRRPLDDPHPARRLPGHPPLRRVPPRPRHRPPGPGRPPAQARRARRAREASPTRSTRPATSTASRRWASSCRRPRRADALGRPATWPATRRRPPCSCTSPAATSSTRASLRPPAARRSPRPTSQPSRPGAPAATGAAATSGTAERSAPCHDLLTPRLARPDGRAPRAVRDAATARGSPTRPRCSSRSRCCAATSAATARSPSRRPGSTRPTSTPERGAAPSPGRGAAAGCHEALFTLGERPEAALPGRRASGWPSTATPPPSTTWPPCAALVLDETGLLPHANAGALLRRRAGRAPAGVALARG